MCGAHLFLSIPFICTAMFLSTWDYREAGNEVLNKPANVHCDTWWKYIKTIQWIFLCFFSIRNDTGNISWALEAFVDHNQFFFWFSFHDEFFVRSWRNWRNVAGTMYSETQRQLQVLCLKMICSSCRKIVWTLSLYLLGMVT